MALEELRVTEEGVRVQNDALHDGLGSVEAVRKRFQSLFHLAPVAYLVTDRFGVVRQANLRAVGLLGMTSQARLRGDLVTQLQGALDSAIVIEQAKGVLMERDASPTRRPSTGCAGRPDHGQ